MLKKHSRYIVIVTGEKQIIMAGDRYLRGVYCLSAVCSLSTRACAFSYKVLPYITVFYHSEKENHNHVL